MSQILVFGDSITWGAWDSRGGWVARLREEIDKGNFEGKYYWAVHNLGISGNTTKDLLTRFENETKSRIKEEGETIIIIAIGSNDASWIKSKKDNWIKFNDFEKNMDKLIKQAKKITDKVIILGIPKVDESLTAPVDWDRDYYSYNKDMKKYEECIIEICEKEKIDFIGMHNLIDKTQLADGLHPNDKGHETIFRRVYDYLVKSKFI